MGPNRADGIRRVAVIGAGLMGHGIAQGFAVAGLEVSLTDRAPKVLQEAPARIQGNLCLMEEMGRLGPDEIGQIMSRISLEPNLASAVKEADFVCETVSEDLRLKQALFAEMDALCPPATILATNTSSLSLSQVGALVRRQDKIITTHYLNPPHFVPLVEVMKGGKTSEDTLRATLALMRRCGWVPVVLKKEVPGYIANRLLMALYREAITLVQDGVAEAEDVDLTVKAGIGIRMPVIGLLEVADLAGLNLMEAVLRNLSPEISSETTPPALLSEMVRRDELGIKTGKGFYDWRQRSQAELIRLRDRHLIQMRLALWEKGGPFSDQLG
ncbi:MAG: 3-hydroxyacyl-CoA dehydrogenase family protein [bacterium]